MVSDERFNSIVLLLIALVGGGATILTAHWSRGANKNAKEAAAQVRTNGGMSDPDPNLNDHAKYNTQMLETLVLRVDGLEKSFLAHKSHSEIMDVALAEVYLHVKPQMRLQEGDSLDHPE